MRSILFSYLLLLYWHTANAQTNFVRFSTKDGLASNDVRGIVKDKNDFLWVSTKKGLMRYDGHRFMPSTHQNWSLNIATDTTNTIYVSSYGLLALNARNGKVDTLFKKNDYDSDPDNDHFENVFIDSRGRIWGNDFHFIKYIDPKSKALKTFRFSKDITDNSLVADFYEDGNAQLWIVTRNGLYRFDEKTQRLITIIGNYNFTAICQTNDGKIWLGSDNEGLFWYDVTVKKLNPLPNGLKIGVSALCPTPDNGLWVGTYGKLFRMRNLALTEVSNLSTEGYDFHRIFRDSRTHNYWFGTSNGLLSLNEENEAIQQIKFNASQVGFPVKAICFLAESENVLWVGLSNGGILRWNLTTHTAQSFKTNGVVNDLKFDNQKRLWIGTSMGLYLLKNNAVVKINTQTESILKLLIDKQQRLWTLTSHDAEIIDTKTQKAIILWDKARYQALWQDNLYNDICQTADGKVWLAAWFPKGYGALYFDEQKHEFVELSTINDHAKFIGDYFLAVSPDSKGGVVYSGYSGVMRFDANGQVLQRIDGDFADSKLQHLVEDKNKNIWVGTGEGLNLLKTNGDRLRFNEFDGLSGNDLTQGFLLHQNKLFLGQTNGFDVFDVAQFTQKKTFGTPQLCSYQIQDKHPVFDIKESFVFEREQNTLTFHCATLDYTQLLQQQYQYKFTNEANWSTATSDPTFTFHNLKAGDYTLLVRMGDGSNWNNNPLAIKFSIKPFFYETTWFYLLILSIIAAMGYAFYRYRINQFLRLQALREHISQDLHDEVGATLSSINILNTIAQSKLKPTHEVWRYLDRITEDTQSLQTKLEEILWSLRRDRDNLPQLVARIRRFASELFEAKGIDYEFLFDENFDNQSLAMETRQHIYLICKEAINNLLKYSACTKASIKITVQQKQLHIAIADNGRGFDTDKAFEGNGLKNMQRRCKELGGKLSIDSKINEGTTIVLQTKITQKGD